MAALPYECYANIVSHIDRKNLPGLLQICKTFQSITEPLLYRRIHSDSAKLKVLCQALLQISSGPKGQYVRTLELKLARWRRAPKMLNAFVRLIARVLRNTPNLDHLVLVDLPSHCAWVLEDCTAQPRTFVTSLSPAGLGPWLNMQRRMEVFVHANKEPEHWHETIDVSPDALPKLRIVCARGDILRKVVPGRPVEHVAQDFTLDYEQEASEDMFDELKHALDKSTAPLRTLGIQFRPAPDSYVIRSDCPVFVDSWALPLKTVETLDMYIPTFLHFEAFHELGTALEGFPSLKRIEVAGGHIFGTYSSKALEGAACSWRMRCSTLTQITFRERADTGRYQKTPSMRACVFLWDDVAKSIVLAAGAISAPAVGLTEYEEHADGMITALRRSHLRSSPFSS